MKRRVSTHDANCSMNCFQLTPDRPSVIPIPTIAPTMHWLEDVGSVYCAPIMIMKAVASSAHMPLVGDSFASFTPMARVTL